MSTLAVAASLAAGSAVTAAYVEAKLHVWKDLTVFRRLRTIQKDILDSVKDKKSSLWPVFEEQVKSRPESALCIWSRDGCYTWKQTYDMSNKYANYLRDRGVKPDALVATYLSNSPDFMFTSIALWALGAGAALINSNLAGDALIHCLRVSRTKLVVVDGDSDYRVRIDEVRDRIEKELGMEIVFLDAPTKEQIQQCSSSRIDDSYRKAVMPTSTVALLYTSGSTGMPKAITWSNMHGIAMRRFHTWNLGLEKGDGIYVCMPMYHGTANLFVMHCVTAGTMLCIGKRFSTTRFWDDVRDSHARAFVYVGETARYLLAAPPSPLDRQHDVKTMYGNGLRPDVWAKFQERFGIATVCEFFNSSEGHFGLRNRCEGPYLQNAVGHHGALQRWTYRNIYVPVEVDHDTGDIVRDPKTGLAARRLYEEGGEMLVKLESEAAWRGYFHDADASAKKIARNVLQRGDVFYRTGDALRRTSDGRWYFMDRLGDTYRWKSGNVSTAEVADVLGRFPGVEEAVVFGVAVPGHDGRAGCAALVLSPSVSPTSQFLAELLAFCRSNMAHYAVPVFIRLLGRRRTMHNNKQEKGPLKQDGIDLDAIYGPDTDAKDAASAGKDIMLYWPQGLGSNTRSQGKSGSRKNAENRSETYVPFTRQSWNAMNGRARATL